MLFEQVSSKHYAICLKVSKSVRITSIVNRVKDARREPTAASPNNASLQTGLSKKTFTPSRQLVSTLRVYKEADVDLEVVPIAKN